MYASRQWCTTAKGQEKTMFQRVGEGGRSIHSLLTVFWHPFSSMFHSVTAIPVCPQLYENFGKSMRSIWIPCPWTSFFLSVLLEATLSDCSFLFFFTFNDLDRRDVKSSNEHGLRIFLSESRSRSIDRHFGVVRIFSADVACVSTVRQCTSFYPLRVQTVQMHWERIFTNWLSNRLRSIFWEPQSLKNYVRSKISGC